MFRSQCLYLFIYLYIFFFCLAAMWSDIMYSRLIAPGWRLRQVQHGWGGEGAGLNSLSNGRHYHTNVEVLLQSRAASKSR